MRKLGLAVPMLLAACATTPAAPVSGGTCQNETLGTFVGREATERTLAELQKASGAKTMRVVQPGMMVTMDYREDRLTVRLSADNRIMSVKCG